MKPLLSVILALPAVAQQPCAIGSIGLISPTEIVMRNGLRLAIDKSTEIVKARGQELKPGDEVSVRCSRPGAAAKIWANVLDFPAVIRYLNPASVEVVTMPREERKVVALYASTAYSTSKKDLAVGQELRIVGVDLGEGRVDAIRITIYNTDLILNRLK